MAVRKATIKNRFAKLPFEELRFALVLNGGVSLAVWMGGVAVEIDRLTRGRGGYRAVLDGARTNAIVDVISGTSAGGINGAALALAQANERGDLMALRNLWSEQGRMETLLRSPFQGKPTSLLRGDDYFLPELHRAMKMLAYPFEPRRTDDQGNPLTTPLDLTLTTTLLTGAQQITIDDFGEPLPQRVHDANFHFTNVVDKDGPAGPEAADLFAEGQIEDTAAALALAARCTASFPFAFEPSFVPVGEPADRGQAPLRPDMARFASWRDDDIKSPQSRYAMDGGVLANTPVVHALRAIDRRQADGPVRRAMLLVFPHAPKAAEVPADKAATPPPAVGALTGMFGALQSQGSRTFVDRVEEHNKKAAEWRGSRDQLLEAFGAGTGSSAAQSVYELLGTAWPHYRHIRIRIAAVGLADRVRPRAQWPYERIRDAAEQAQRKWLAEQGELPYVPRQFGWNDPGWVNDHIRDANAWRWGDTAARGVTEAVAELLDEALSVATNETQKKKLTQARLDVGTAINEIVALRREVDKPWEDPALLALVPNKTYWRARLIAYGLAMHHDATQVAQGELTDLPVRTADPAGRDSVEVRKAQNTALRAIQARNGATGKTVAGHVRDGVESLVKLREELDKIGKATEKVSSVSLWWRYLFAPLPPRKPAGAQPSAATGSAQSLPRATTPSLDDAIDDLLLRLVALDAATRLLAEGSITGSNRPIKLAELSLRAEHPWARFSRTPDDKAAGLEIARFGGFLKRSWRINDWTWGRLDAATMLCQTVLDPARLRRLIVMSGLQSTDDAVNCPHAILDMLRADLYPDEEQPELAYLEKGALEDLRCVVDAVFDPNVPDPLYLPRLARWAALPLQAEIILEELPALAAAIRVDANEGAGTPTRGTRFLASAGDEKQGLLARIEALALPPVDDAATKAWRAERFRLGCEALAAFDAAGIGREPLAEEVGSNNLIRTVSRAAGVLATVLDSDAEKVRPLKPITKAVRGALLVPYWMVTGLAGGGTIAKFLATTGLVVGGVLVALSLFGVLGGAASAAGTLGAAILLAGLAYSAARTGTLLHAAALLAPVGPMVAYAGTVGDAEEAASRVLVVLLAAVALYVLASLPWPMHSPRHTLQVKAKALSKAVVKWFGTDTLRRVGIMGGLLAAAGAVVVGWFWWLDDTAAIEWLRELDGGWRDAPVSVGVGLGLVVAVGIAIAYRQGTLLRQWHTDGGTPTQYPARLDRGGATGGFRRDVVRHPAGVAGTWAPVYGAAYLVAAVVLFGLTEPSSASAGREGWVVFSLWWLVVIGIVLCLVAPVAVTRPPRRKVHALLREAWPRLEAELAAAPAADSAAEESRAPWPGRTDQKVLYALLKYGLAYHYLVESRPVEVGQQGAVLRLHPWRGKRLLRQLDQAPYLEAESRRQMRKARGGLLRRSPTGNAGDDELLADLDARSDPRAPRHWVHHLRFDDESAARDAAGEIAGSGEEDADPAEPVAVDENAGALEEIVDEETWRVAVAAEGGKWAVVAEKDRVVTTPEAVRQARRYFEEVASRHAGQYIRWEAWARGPSRGAAGF